MSLATLKRFLWSTHKTLKHIHFIALYFVEEAVEKVDVPPLPQLQNLWLRLLDEQPQRSMELLQWLMLSPQVRVPV